MGKSGAACAILAISLIAQPVHAQDNYILGHGYNIGPVNFAGYSNLELKLPDHGQKSATLEDLSLFATGHFSKWFNPFVEAELTHLVLAHSSPSGDDRTEPSLTMERYYNDSYITNTLTLRVGKMLAPVGEWNLIHAAPLVLSTIRPAVTYRNFSAYVRGVSMLYSDPDGVTPDIQVYWQPDQEEDEKPRGISFGKYRSTEGLHISLPVSLLDKIGVSYQHAIDTYNVSQSLYGADFYYKIGKLTFQGEATYSSLSDGTSPRIRNSEAGGYLGASYALNDRWSAYSWYEAFLTRNDNSAAQDAMIGVAYRPHPAMIIKMEYLDNFGGPAVNPTGFFASWSVLF